MLIKLSVRNIALIITLFYFGYSVITDTQTHFSTMSLNSASKGMERECTIATSVKIESTNQYQTTFISVFRPHNQITKYKYFSGEVASCWSSGDTVVIEQVPELPTSFFVWYIFNWICLFVTVICCTFFFI